MSLSRTRQPTYADAWRRGFRRGAADALRVAARELTPDAAAQLDHIAQRYETVGERS